MSENTMTAREIFAARARAQKIARIQAEHKKPKSRKPAAPKHTLEIPEGFVPVVELARKIGQTPDSLYAAVTRGTLFVVKIGRSMYATQAAIDNYLEITRTNLLKSARSAGAARRAHAAERRESSHD